MLARFLRWFSASLVCIKYKPRLVIQILKFHRASSKTKEDFGLEMRPRSKRKKWFVKILEKTNCRFNTNKTEAFLHAYQFVYDKI